MKLFSPKPIPHSFVLEELERLGVHTKAMFGCTAVYHAEKILMVLRERASGLEDNGIWVATYAEHHGSLRKQLPSLRSIQIFGPGETGWQCLPSSSPTFEEEAFRLCALVMKRDSRIGRVPKSKLPRKPKGKKKNAGASRSKRASRAAKKRRAK